MRALHGGLLQLLLATLNPSNAACQIQEGLGDKRNGNSAKWFAAMKSNVLAPKTACGPQHEAN